MGVGEGCVGDMGGSEGLYMGGSEGLYMKDEYEMNMRIPSRCFSWCLFAYI